VVGATAKHDLKDQGFNLFFIRTLERAGGGAESPDPATKPDSTAITGSNRGRLTLRRIWAARGRSPEFGADAQAELEARLRRPTNPIPKSPMSIIAQVEGSGTGSASGLAALDAKKSRFGVARKEWMFSCAS
jgi:hypothetical protein